MVQIFVSPWSLKGDLIYVFGLRRSTFLCAAYAVFYVTFMIVGAVVFTRLEQPEEDKLVRKLKLAKIEFIDKNPGLDRKCIYVHKQIVRKFPRKYRIFAMRSSLFTG